MPPTQTGRESAAERKTREGEEAVARDEGISAAALASTGVVCRLRPQGIGVRVERGDIPTREGEVEEGDVCSLDLGVPGAMINVEFPATAMPAFAVQVYNAWKAHQEATGGDVPKVQAATPADVQQAAAAAAAAQRLREEQDHG